jgi:hypothetical protein
VRPGHDEPVADIDHAWDVPRVVDRGPASVRCIDLAA